MKTTLRTDLTVADICAGTESEIKAWYKTINITGPELKKQEIANAIYSGAFVTAAKAVFSNSTNSNLYVWENFFKGNVKRQELLRTALEWVVKSSNDKAVEDYMSRNRLNSDISELENYHTRRKTPSMVNAVNLSDTIVKAHRM